MSQPCAVYPEEVDAFVESLKPFQIVDIGCEAWFEQHEIILKLTQQTYIEATTKQEEMIKERLLLEAKLPILVHEAYGVLLWRTKVLPELMLSKKVNTTFVLYTVFYHEANALALLEILLFHRACCEALGDSALDLVDYCVHSMGQLIGLLSNGYNERDTNVTLNESAHNEVERFKRDLSFKIGIKCITIVGYLVDSLDGLPLSAATRVVRVHDVPCMIAEILHAKPWLRRKQNGGFEKYINDTWTPAQGDEVMQLTKTEAQAWFCLYKIMLSDALRKDYEINEYRQRVIGKCTGLLNDQLLDQLPNLVQLKQYLCTLQMTHEGTPNTKSKLMLEEIPVIRDQLVANAEKLGWKTIVEKQKLILIDLELKDITERAKRISSAYRLDVMEQLMPEAAEERKTPICGSCGKSAEKRCAQCTAVFYCTRECQAKDWPNHKELCHQLKPTKKGQK